MPRMASMNTTQPTRIYIVDDSASIRSRLVDMLGRMDEIEVVGESGNAPDAVEGIISMQPRSVLLDLNLNGTSGMHVLRAVRQVSPHIVFVVLTNHSEPQYRRACERAGAHYFLDKSTEFDRVRDVIAEIASTRH
jgi:two-component system, NarL family, response regulator DevR